VDQNKSSFGTGAEGGGRPDRPLGRGLEDISHLFQSARSGEAAANEPPAGSSPQSSPQRATPQRGSRASAVLLGPRTALTRDQLAPLLKEFHGALEEGLTSIDSEIACPPCGEIDLLGLSRSNQLTIIDFDTNADEGLLIRGIGHVEWVTRNISIIRRLYPGQTINYSLPPALILVAPQFSPGLRSVARQVTRPTIKWVRYSALESTAGLGVFFERVEGE
jgi:hypothetical protein